ncbi:MAG: hypothetical protein B6D63_04120 [Candidatus Latescibacteria bacterium 4484_7]|nr:MAG: hypothetical protein B6D63_04120 [Candidatus Latescibacteria bacterium 4484_7]
MALEYNGNEVKKVVYNGTEIDELFHNGNKVFYRLPVLFDVFFHALDDSGYWTHTNRVLDNERGSYFKILKKLNTDEKDSPNCNISDSRIVDGFYGYQWNYDNMGDTRYAYIGFEIADNGTKLYAAEVYGLTSPDEYPTSWTRGDGAVAIDYDNLTFSGETWIPDEYDSTGKKNIWKAETDSDGEAGNLRWIPYGAKTYTFYGTIRFHKHLYPYVQYTTDDRDDSIVFLIKNERGISFRVYNNGVTYDVDSGVDHALMMACTFDDSSSIKRMYRPVFQFSTESISINFTDAFDSDKSKNIALNVASSNRDNLNPDPSVGIQVDGNYLTEYAALYGEKAGDVRASNDYSSAPLRSLPDKEDYVRLYAVIYNGHPALELRKYTEPSGTETLMSRVIFT